MKRRAAISSFGSAQIILANVLSVIPVQTCVLGASKESSRRNGETVLLSTQDKCLSLKKTIYMSIKHSYPEVCVLSPRKYCNEDSGPPKRIV